MSAKAPDIRIRTSLQNKQPIVPWDDEQLRAKAMKLFQESGTIMIKPQWVPNEFDRQHLINVAEKTFGRRA